MNESLNEEPNTPLNRPSYTRSRVDLHEPLHASSITCTHACVDPSAPSDTLASAPSKPAAADSRVLRIATYNIHGAIGCDGVYMPQRIADVIAELDADIVALQEFTYPASIAVETRSPVVLTTLDSYTCATGPTRQNITQCFGNALFTRHPIVDVHRIDLSMERREPRGAIAATVNVRGELVHVLAAHLGLKVHERRFQVQQIVEYLDSVRNTLFVVLGDFNDWLPGRSVVHVLDQRLGRQPRPASFPVKWPLVALDRIWVHPGERLMRVDVHRTPLSRIASDHYPLIAHIAHRAFASLRVMASNTTRSSARVLPMASNPDSVMAAVSTNVSMLA